jgi:hypothetical protein
MQLSTHSEHRSRFILLATSKRCTIHRCSWDTSSSQRQEVPPRRALQRNTTQKNWTPLDGNWWTNAQRLLDSGTRVNLTRYINDRSLKLGWHTHSLYIVLGYACIRTVAAGFAQLWNLQIDTKQSSVTVLRSTRWSTSIRVCRLTVCRRISIFLKGERESIYSTHDLTFSSGTRAYLSEGETQTLAENITKHH